MNRMKWIMPAALSVLLVLMATPLIAQTAIDETRPLDSSATLSVSNISGSVTITGWNGSEVQVTGTLGKGSKELRISGDSGRMDIEVILPEHSRNVKPTHLEISLPRSCHLEVSTVSANIGLIDFDGDIELESVSGDITAACGAGRVEISSVSGEVILESDSDNTEVESVSGDVRISGISGVLSSSTVSGDILVEGGTVVNLNAETVSGNLQFNIGLSSDARVEVDSHSGDVVFLLAGGLPVDCSVDTFSGSINNEFGLKGIADNYSHGSVYWESPGSGTGKMEINTFSGDVLLK